MRSQKSSKWPASSTNSFETRWNSWLSDIPSGHPNIGQRSQIIFASESVALLSLSRSSSFRSRIIFDYVIVMAAKKEPWGAWSGNWIIRPGGCQFVAERLDFLIIAHNVFRILRSCPLRVHIFLSQHLPDIPLLENVRFTMFSVTITNIWIGSAKPWQQQMWMKLHYLWQSEKCRWNQDGDILEKHLEVASCWRRDDN
jgi:hypothetical protein